MSTVDKRLYEIADYLITTGNQADAFFLRKLANPVKQYTFMVGQRVIYSKTICTICVAPDGKLAGHHVDYEPWIELPTGVKQCVSPDNIKPLPNGQF